jgi:ribosomal protein L11 methyltransferase
VFFPSVQARDQARRTLEQSGLEGVQVVSADVGDEDWARRSQAALGPVRVGNILVSPPWAAGAANAAARAADRRLPADPPNAPSPLELVILPSMGFGSGHHASTRLCLQLLQELDLRGRTVLDIGTGSGVLAIAAHKLGAVRVVAFDDDADALDSARENLALNGLSGDDRVEIRHADFRSVAGLHADVVLANLTAALLIQSAARLAASVACHGSLIVSGFTTDDEGGVGAACAGLQTAARVTEEGWVGMRLVELPPEARHWIEHLGLVRHPEGGYYRETYRAAEQIPQRALPARFTGDRPFSTAIYFLLAGSDYSAFHRVRADEGWHFHAGGSLTLHVIAPDGRLSELHLGPNVEEGEAFQAVVRAGCWFAATLAPGSTYALVGCTVAPGFDFEDFELAGRDELAHAHPQHRAIIERLTRG